MNILLCHLFKDQYIIHLILRQRLVMRYVWVKRERKHVVIIYFRKCYFRKSIAFEKRQFLITALHINSIVDERDLPHLSVYRLLFVFNELIAIVFKYFVDRQVLRDE